MNAEKRRLIEAGRRTQHWRRWGPYLSERAWGTVREDYSANGAAWDYFPFEHAHVRAYRWGEDGIGGISDNHQRLCFSFAFWNGRDAKLKERLFGLTGSQGNHGEDVKEYYYYLDATPTYSYMKFLYKYPQAAFPYDLLKAENQRRGRNDPEFELLDTGAFNEDRYFDALVEYAKAEANDIVIRVTLTNRGPDAAALHVLPTLWFRNTWSWGSSGDVGQGERGTLRRVDSTSIDLDDRSLGAYRFQCEGQPELLFTENETDALACWGAPNEREPHRKDAFQRYVIEGQKDAVNPEQRGTKACAWYRLELAPGESRTLRMRLTLKTEPTRLLHDIDDIFAERICETDEFYSFASHDRSPDAKQVQRQAFAGLLWSKQFYHYSIADWLKGDPGQPVPPADRLRGRNSQWVHLHNEDVLSMPDSWEYPWYASWDLAFHMIPLALVDPENAKAQLKLFLREWYMHPNGQIPAYEWAFGDVNPPVHAWACWRVFQIDRKITGEPDYPFLEGAFHKLLLNFTWWVNRKDSDGSNIFEGGFLGLDNIGVFDRSAPPPTRGSIQPSHRTRLIARFCFNMLQIA